MAMMVVLVLMALAAGSVLSLATPNTGTRPGHPLLPQAAIVRLAVRRFFRQWPREERRQTGDISGQRHVASPGDVPRVDRRVSGYRGRQQATSCFAPFAQWSRTKERELEIQIYDQNIWGNMGAKQAIANRNSLIRDLISACDPDVCCFQECSPRTSRVGATAIQDLLADRYVEVETPAGAQNYTPLFFLRDKYRLLDRGWHLYTGGPERNDCSSKSITWAVLEDMTTGAAFGVCSTHFWWKSDTALDNQQRIQNAVELCEIITAMAGKHDVPVLAAGDLNCGTGSAQGSEPYHFLLERGLLDTRAVAAVTTDAFTHHEYPLLNDMGIYEKGGRPVRTLDHVLATAHPRMRITRFHVETSQRALDSSDHCPLIVGASIVEPGHAM